MTNPEVGNFFHPPEGIPTGLEFFYSPDLEPEFGQQFLTYIRNYIMDYGPFFPSVVESVKLLNQPVVISLVDKMIQIENTTTHKPFSHAVGITLYTADIARQINQITREAVGTNFVDEPLLISAAFLHDIGNMIDREEIEQYNLEKVDLTPYLVSYPEPRPSNTIDEYSSHILKGLAFLEALGFPQHANVVAHSIYHLDLPEAGKIGFENWQIGGRVLRDDREKKMITIERLLLMLLDNSMDDREVEETWFGVEVVDLLEKFDQAYHKYGLGDVDIFKLAIERLLTYTTFHSLLSDMGVRFPNDTSWANKLSHCENHLVRLKKVALLSNFLFMCGIKRRGYPHRQFLDFTNTEWGQDRINSRLSQLEDRIDKEAESRTIEGQFIIVKTASSPSLIARFLAHLTNNLDHTNARSPVYIGVVDDSKDDEQRDAARSIITYFMEKSGIPIVYLPVKEQNGTESLIGRIRNRIFATSEDREAKERSRALEYLLTERFNLYKLESNLGGGFASTVNFQTLLGAYLMGRFTVSPDRAICTFNEDDIVYQTFREEEVTPVLDQYDFLRGREILFSDPKKVFVAGKYVGMSGNPFKILTDALQVSANILQDMDSDKPPDSPSQYYLFSPKTGHIDQVTIQEAYDRLPEIIQNFLNRTPITQFIHPTPPGQHWIFDLGNFSTTGTLARQFPFPTAGIPEFTMTGILKSLFPNPGSLDMEQQIIHLRSVREGGMDVYGSSVVTGMLGSPTHDQAILESVATNPDETVVYALQAALGKDNITPQEVLSKSPTLQVIRADKVEKIKEWREIIENKLTAMQQAGLSNQLVLSLKRLVTEVSEENLARIDRHRAKIPSDQPETRRATKYIKRFLKAASYWPELFDLAYQLGKEDSVLS